MDGFTLGAALLGLAGAVLGVLGWQQAREARSIAERALKEAAKSTSRGGDIPRAANGPLSGRPAVNPPGPEATPARPTRQPAPHVTDGTAHIVARPGSGPGRDLPTNQGSGSGLIGIFLVNEGPATAHDMQLHAVFPNGTRRSSELHRTLSAHKELTLFAQVTPADFGAHDPLHLHYLVAYRDGNGAQSLERDIRLEGGWKGPWKTYIELNEEDG